MLDRKWMEEREDRLDREMRERQDRLDAEAGMRQDRLDVAAGIPPPPGLWHALMERFMKNATPGIAPPAASEPWVATGEFGVTVEDKRRAAGSF